MSPQILVTTSAFAVADHGPVEHMEAAGYEVRLNPYGRRLTRAEILDLLADEGVVGLVAGLEPLDREVLETSHLRVISRVGSGVSNVDLDAAHELGIEVHTTPDGPTSAVAELTIGALLSLLRDIPSLNADLKDGRWVKRTGGQIAGRTVLVVGFGRIGQRVAALLSAFEAEVLVCDPLASAESTPFPVVSLSDGYSRADVICFHNSGEDCVLSDQHLYQLKPGVLILNAARGGVASESSLRRGLEEEIIGGVWLDVFETEPYTGSLTGHPRTLLTPHVGSYTSECRVKMEGEAVRSLLASLAGCRNNAS